MVFFSSFSFFRLPAYSFHAFIKSSSVNELSPLVAVSSTAVLVTATSLFASEVREIPIPDNLLFLNFGEDGLVVAILLSVLISFGGLSDSFLAILSFFSNSVLELLLTFSIGFNAVFFLTSASASVTFN